MKLFTSTLITAAAALTLAGAAQAQVTVTTGGGYIKMVEALTAQYEKDTGAKVEKAFGGNIGQMLAQVESGSPVTVVISDATSLKKFTKALNADAGVRLGDTPLILIWRKGLTLASPEDLTSDAVKRVARCPTRRPQSTDAQPRNTSMVPDLQKKSLGSSMWFQWCLR